MAVTLSRQCGGIAISGDGRFNPPYPSGWPDAWVTTVFHLGSNGELLSYRHNLGPARLVPPLFTPVFLTRRLRAPFSLVSPCESVYKRPVPGVFRDAGRGPPGPGAPTDHGTDPP